MNLSDKQMKNWIFEHKILTAMAGIILFVLIISIIIPDKPQITGEVVKGPETEIETPVEKEPSFVEKGFVSKVIDGDTVIINGESVRLLGIDADERGYPCYKEAKDRIEVLILNEEVKLEKDGEDKDQYDRDLRYIFLNRENINLQLVKEGLAVARFYPLNVKYREEILAAEKEARENKIGCKWEEQLIEEPKEKEEPKETETKTEYDSCVDLGCPKGTQYVGSLKSDKYHECYCQWAEKIYKENLNCFKSKSEAKSQGYVACKVCEP